MRRMAIIAIVLELFWIGILRHRVGDRELKGVVNAIILPDWKNE